MEEGVVRIRMADEYIVSDEALEEIEHLGSMNYHSDYIAIYLQLDRERLAEALSNPETEIYKRYNRGRLLSSYEINKKLDANARAGNITAMQQFAKNQRAALIENLKKKYFG